MRSHLKKSNRRATLAPRPSTATLDKKDLSRSCPVSWAPARRSCSFQSGIAREHRRAVGEISDGPTHENAETRDSHHSRLKQIKFTANSLATPTSLCAAGRASYLRSCPMTPRSWTRHWSFLWRFIVFGGSAALWRGTVESCVLLNAMLSWPPFLLTEDTPKPYSSTIQTRASCEGARSSSDSDYWALHITVRTSENIILAFQGQS